MEGYELPQPINCVVYNYYKHVHVVNYNYSVQLTLKFIYHSTCTCTCTYLYTVLLKSILGTCTTAVIAISQADFILLVCYSVSLLL